MGLMIGWPCSQHSDNILIIEKPKAITPTNGPRSVSIDQDPVPLQTQPGPMKPPIIDSLFFFFYSLFLLLVSVCLSLPVPLYFSVFQCTLLDVLYGETTARRGLWALLLSKKFITKPGIFAEEWLFSSPLLSAFLYGPSLLFGLTGRTGLISALILFRVRHLYCGFCVCGDSLSFMAWLF